MWPQCVVQHCTSMNGQLLDTRLLLLVHTARLLGWCRWQGPLHGRQARSRGVSGCCMPGLMSAGSSAPLGQQRRWGGGRGRARPYPTGRWAAPRSMPELARFAPLRSCWHPDPTRSAAGRACMPPLPPTYPHTPRRFVNRPACCSWRCHLLLAQPAPKLPGPGTDTARLAARASRGGSRRRACGGRGRAAASCRARWQGRAAGGAAVRRGRQRALCAPPRLGRAGSGMRMWHTALAGCCGCWCCYWVDQGLPHWLSLLVQVDLANWRPVQGFSSAGRLIVLIKQMDCTENNIMCAQHDARLNWSGQKLAMWSSQAKFGLAAHARSWLGDHLAANTRAGWARCVAQYLNAGERVPGDQAGARCK